MMGEKRTFEWLEHRAGIRRLPCHPKPYSNRALELSDKGDAFAAAYGRKQIRGYIGFVDLIGFSERVKGLSPLEISDHLRPFICGVVSEACRFGALVDKTIGDEVMFIVPDMEEDGGVPAALEVRPLLVALHDLQRGLGPRYPFRIGLSYGVQLVDRIEGKGYREWTIVGESVILAKRLHGLPGAEPNDGIGGAFGVLVRETNEDEFRSILESIAGFGVPMTHRLEERRDDLKGVSAAWCALLAPKVSSSQWRPGMRFD